jgi:hypothetical protein
MSKKINKFKNNLIYAEPEKVLAAVRGIMMPLQNSCGLNLLFGHILYTDWAI